MSSKKDRIHYAKNIINTSSNYVSHIGSPHILKGRSHTVSRFLDSDYRDFHYSNRRLQFYGLRVCLVNNNILVIK